MARAACIAALAFLAACSGADGGEVGPTASVERGTIERRVVATGTIEPEKEIEVRPRISGVVETVHVKAGDRVVAGQPLVEVEKELAEVRLEEASARVAEARAEQRFAESARARAERLHRNGTMDDQEYDEILSRSERARAGVARAEASRDLLAVQLRYATVEAPIDGKILDVDVEEGSAVASVVSVNGGTALLSIASDDLLHLEGLVDENEIAKVEIGQPARVTAEAFGDEVFDGRVEEISPIGDRRQNVTYFEVEIAIGEHGGRLRPRMSADADIIAEVLEDVLVVPEAALHYEGEDLFIERVVSRDPPATERMPIEIGIVEDDRIQVVSGVEEGWELKLR